MAINGVLLMPIRVISISIIMLVAVTSAYIITFGCSAEMLKKKPLTGWRKSIKYILRFCGRAIAFCFGFHSIKKNGVRATREEV